jgi:hypothetical protein
MADSPVIRLAAVNKKETNIWGFMNSPIAAGEETCKGQGRVPDLGRFSVAGIGTVERISLLYLLGKYRVAEV